MHSRLSAVRTPLTVGAATGSGDKGESGAPTSLRLLGLLVGASLLLLGLVPTAAQAQTTFGSPGTGAGQLESPEGVAVDQSSGDVYVADNQNNRVDVFSAAGAFIEAFGWGVADGASTPETCTTTCQQGLSGSGAGQFSGPSEIAVDQSTHDVYVVDYNNRRVEKFDSSGNFILMFGGDVNTTTGGDVCTASSGNTCGAGVFGTGNGQFSYPAGAAVDSSGNVYVGDWAAGNTGRVQEFNSSGVFTGQLSFPTNGSPGPVAVDQNGNIFEYGGKPATAAVSGVYELSQSGLLLNTFDSAGKALALALDANGDLFVLDSTAGNSVLEFDSQGAEVDAFPGSAVTGTSGGVAFANATQTLYAADSTSDDVVAVSTAPPPGPYVGPTSEYPSNVGLDTATVNAAVNPEGNATSIHFEYGTTTGYGETTPESGSIGSDASFHAISSPLSGLQPGTTYHFRAVATDSNGVTTHGPDETLTTYPSPSTQSCPNAASRYGDGVDLPDCRAYEQVSPSDKGQNDIIGQLPTVSSPDGNAAAFGAYTPLPDSPAGGFQTGYASARSATSWQTSPLSPPVSTALERGAGQDWEYGVSPDLTKVLVRTYVALTPGAVPANNNFYGYDTTSGSYQLIFTSSTLSGFSFAGASSGGSFVFSLSKALDSTPAPAAGSSTNLYDWSPGGAVGLVGILPGGSADPKGSVAAGSGALQAADHVVSADGSRVYWVEPSGASPLYLRDGDQTNVVSQDASGTAHPATFLYATPDGSHALITSSVPLTADAGPAGTSNLYSYDADTGQLTDLTPGSSSPGLVGTFGSSDDGSYVYFLATSALASGAIAGDDNIFVSHLGTTRFVGALASDASEIASRMTTGIGTQWRVSPDGLGFGFLFDGAISGPHPQPAQPYNEAYYYSYQQDSLACGSCVPTGIAPTGPARFVNTAVTLMLGNYAQAQLAVTNGGRMFFTSPDALAAGDTNGVNDVYEYELDGSGSCQSTAANGGCLSLISSGKGDAGSYFGAASVSGNDVFFGTFDRLVGQDQDNSQDLYDARVGGGLASQNPPPPLTPCTGEVCKGAPTTAPPAPVVATVSFSGPGDPTSRGASTAKAKVLTRVVRRVSFVVRVHVPSRGKLVISGTGIRPVRKSESKGGTYRLRVTLTGRDKRLLRRRHRLKLRLRVVFTPAGGSAQTATVRLAVHLHAQRKVARGNGGTR